jgi:hypothetical protein
VIVETEDMTFEVLTNDAGAQGGGAGIQAAGQVASKKVDAVIHLMEPESMCTSAPPFKRVRFIPSFYFSQLLQLYR